ncbi:MAG: hypothetical protein EBZ76_08930 [Synechococcaceae bacterium WB9_2_170]|nr:hypothetical protein [Synechococcaceae bacterium WB9_2_170]
MRVLIFTSSGGTAHDAAAYALRDWLALLRPEVEVQVEHVLESGSAVYRGGVSLYNWIQRRQPWLHQIYWRLMELEDLVKPGTLLFGRTNVIRLLRRFRPDVLISTHPHINRGHFDLAKRVLGPNVRCITSNTELAGGFGFSRNWICSAADLHWTLTQEVAQEVARPHLLLRPYPAVRIRHLGPLLYPAFHRAGPAPAELMGRPCLVLGTGANGANNHIRLLEQLLPLADRLEVVVLCGRRLAVQAAVQAWGRRHPHMRVQALGFQGPEQMAELYRRAWALVARPGARTATEALWMACPLIFNHYGTTMPQELLAPRYFQARGLEVSIYQPQQLAEVVGDWLEQPEHYRVLRARYQRQRFQVDPAQLLAELLD